MGEVSLEKAKFHLETAQYFLERLDGVDDLAINMVGFHLAQAVEVFTRHFLEMDSGKVPTLSFLRTAPRLSYRRSLTCSRVR